MQDLAMYRRLRARLVPVNTGCWLWAGSKHRPPRQYGQIRINTVCYLVHRVMWEALHGPIPTGLVVSHRCDVPECARPSHLVLCTQRDNLKDMVQKGRSWMTQRTHCPHGHSYTGTNLKVYRGRRFCNFCAYLRGMCTRICR